MQGGWNPNAGAPGGQGPAQPGAPMPQAGQPAPGGFGAPMPQASQPGQPAPGGFGASQPGQFGQPAPFGQPAQPVQPAQPGAAGFPAPSSPFGAGMPQMPAALGSATEFLRAGFLGSLFDLSFSNFVATKLAKVIYVFGILGSILATLGVAYDGLDRAFLNDYYTDVSDGLLKIALSPLVGIGGIIFSRMMTELLVVQFRIMETLQEINHKTKSE